MRAFGVTADRFPATLAGTRTARALRSPASPENDDTVLLSARKIVLIHFLMRLPDFVRPVWEAADRFVERFVESKVFAMLPRMAVVRRAFPTQRLVLRSRSRSPKQLPRSGIHRR